MQFNCFVVCERSLNKGESRKIKWYLALVSDDEKHWLGCSHCESDCEQSVSNGRAAKEHTNHEINSSDDFSQVFRQPARKAQIGLSPLRKRSRSIKYTSKSAQIRPKGRTDEAAPELAVLGFHPIPLV